MFPCYRQYMLVTIMHHLHSNNFSHFALYQLPLKQRLYRKQICSNLQTITFAANEQLASEKTWFIRYISYRNLQFLNRVIIIRTKVSIFNYFDFHGCHHFVELFGIEKHKNCIILHRTVFFRFPCDYVNLPSNIR